MSKRPIDADLGLMICGVKDSIELHDVELEDIRNCLDVMHKNIKAHATQLKALEQRDAHVKQVLDVITQDMRDMTRRLDAMEEAVKRHADAEREMREGFRACDVRFSKLNDRCDELESIRARVVKDAQESEVREFGQPIAAAANKAAEDGDRIGSYIDQLWESFEVQRAAIIGDGYQQKPATMNGDFYAGALHALDKLTTYMRGMNK